MKFITYFKIIIMVIFVTAIGCSKEKQAEVTPETGNNTDAVTPPTNTGTEDNIQVSGEWVPVRKGNLKEIIPAAGTFRAKQTSKIGPQVSGRIDAVLVDVGSHVKKGDELIRLDPSFFQIELSQRKAELETAKIALSEADREYNRMKNLYEKPEGGQPSIPQKLFDDAKTRFESAKAQIRQAEEAIRYAEERLNETVIRSPYNAVVTSRMVDPGEPVTSTPVTHILEIQEIETLELEFSLPQEMLLKVKKATPIEFEAEGVKAGKSSGTISIIFPSVDEATRTFKCRSFVTNHNNKFSPGLLVKVSVIIGETKNAIIIPIKALTRKNGSWEVTVNENNIPVKKDVKLGITTKEEAEIKEGLKENDKILLIE